MKKRARWIIVLAILLATIPVILVASYEHIYILWNTNKLSPVEKSILDDCLRCESLSRDSRENIIGTASNDIYGIDLEDATCSNSPSGCDCMADVYSVQELREKFPIVKYTQKGVDYCIGVISRGHKKDLINGYEERVRKGRRYGYYEY